MLLCSLLSWKSSENGSSLCRHDSIICPWSDGNRLKLCIINSLTSHLLCNKNIVVNAYKTCKLSVKITCLLSCSFLRTLKNFLCSSFWYLKVKNYGKCPLAKKMFFFFYKKNFFLRNLFTPSSFFEKNVWEFSHLHFASVCLFIEVEKKFTLLFSVWLDGISWQSLGQIFLKLLFFCFCWC